MASSIFGIGTSGLLTAQRQLATTSHNISNVNTEGFARQRAEQAARLPQFAGNGYIGSGVDVQTTVRLANEYLEEQVRDSNSQFGKYDAFYALSTQIDNILANPDSGLAPTMESFFSALQEANDNPSSTPARQVLITEANTMTERFKLLDDRFIQLNDQVNQQLVDLTQVVSDAARSVAQLNVSIVQRTGAGQGDLPNDLIDQREVLIKQIAENIDVSVIYQKDGAANLFVGSGQSLVIGSTAATLSTATNAFNAEDLDIILTQGSGSANITKAVTGGEMQGVLDFKENVLEPSRRGLGRIAIALTEEINQQHQLGMTLQDTGAGFNLGGNFFSDLGGPFTGLPGPGSTTNVSVSITDSRVLSVSDYNLSRDGAGVYTLTRLSDNQTFPPPPAAPVNSIAALNAVITTTEGFTISNDIANNEVFLLRPTFDAAANINVQVNDVLDIALASPIASGAITNADGSAINTGTGDISLPLEYTTATGQTLPLVNTNAANLTDIPMTPQVQLEFESAAVAANEFEITNLPAGTTIDYFDLGTGAWVTGAAVSPIPYDPATDSGTVYIVNYVSGDSFAFQMQGIPNSNDSFKVEENSKPYDDNRNGLLMTKLQTAKTLENNSTDFQAGYAMIVSDVGTKTHSAEVDLLAQQTLGEQAKATREGYSGVNLDEEAADLLKYQQAYQAAARVISAADDMFQALLGAVG